jgi:hypothetical protein
MMLKMKKRMGKEMRKNLSIRQYSSASWGRFYETVLAEIYG